MAFGRVSRDGGELVLFGGQGSTGPLGDTWVWKHQRWDLMHPAQSPPARFDASFAYDPASHTDVLFGGQGASGPLADTWEWNGSNWSEISPAMSPSPRSGASIGLAPTTTSERESGHFYDIVLFGGQGSTGPLGDTWVWNGSNWVQQLPLSSPSPRSNASLAFAPGDGWRWNDLFGTDVLFGGQGSTGPLGDTWVWNGSNWSRRSPKHSPPGLSGATSVFDPLNHKTVLVGGTDVQTHKYGSTWAWNGRLWRVIARRVQLPPPPTSVSASAGSTSATIKWVAPRSELSSPITGYNVTALPGGQSTTVSGSPPATQAELTGLTNGIAYTFTVSSIDAAGTGSGSSPSNPVTPLGAPMAPGHLEAFAENGQVELGWQAPPSSGSVVTSYSVTSSPACASCTGETVLGSPPATSTTVTGLTNATSYTFRVTATNAVATSQPSVSSNPVTPSVNWSPIAPSSPSNIAVTTGDKQFNVTWKPPSINGGDAVNSYTVTASPDVPQPDPPGPSCILAFEGHCLLAPPSSVQSADPTGTWSIQAMALSQTASSSSSRVQARRLA